MRNKPKLLLISAIVFTIVGLLISSGLINVQRLPSLNVVLPVGAILWGLFLITVLFEKESEIAVKDQQDALEKAGQHIPKDETPAKQGAILAR